MDQTEKTIVTGRYTQFYCKVNVSLCRDDIVRAMINSYEHPEEREYMESKFKLTDKQMEEFLNAVNNRILELVPEIIEWVAPNYLPAPDTIFQEE